MRREWIDEGKPRDRDGERKSKAVKANDEKQQNGGDSSTKLNLGETSEPSAKGVESDIAMSNTQNGEAQEESLSVSDNDGSSHSIPQSSKPMSGIPRTGQSPQKPSTKSSQPDESLFFSDDEAPKATAGEDIDDLDALLDEEEQMQEENSNGVSLSAPKPQEHIADDFEDEMEVMAGFDDW